MKPCGEVKHVNDKCVNDMFLKLLILSGLVDTKLVMEIFAQGRDSVVQAPWELLPLKL